MLMEVLQGLSLDSISTHRHRLKEHPYKGRRMRWEQEMFCRKCRADRIGACGREGGEEKEPRCPKQIASRLPVRLCTYLVTLSKLLNLSVLSFHISRFEES